MTDNGREKLSALADGFIKKERQNIFRDLKALAEIPSVASEADGIFPFGAECARALDKAIGLGKKYGFAAENHDYRCASITNGENPRELGIITHLDVVPAGGGWSVPPFDLTERGDKYIGRGALDDKSGFIVGLYALRFFKENNIELPFSVRLIAGSDEETGATDLEYFRTVKKPPEFSVTPDAEFPVCIGEKGILEIEVVLGGLPGGLLELSGGTASNAVPDHARAVFIDRVVTAEGKSAHAAAPENGTNAIGVLAEKLNIKHKIIDFLQKTCSDHTGEALGINSADDKFGSLTCVGSVLKTKNGIAALTLNIRYIPGADAEEIAARIRKTGFEANIIADHKGYLFDGNDKKIQALTRACEYVTKKPCAPYTTGGGTYARWMPRTVAFGIEQPDERSADGRGGPHKRDEFILKKELYSAIKIYILGISGIELG